MNNLRHSIQNYYKITRLDLANDKSFHSSQAVAIKVGHRSTAPTLVDAVSRTPQNDCKVWQQKN